MGSFLASKFDPLSFIPDHLKEFVNVKEQECKLGKIYTYKAKPMSRLRSLKTGLRLDDFTYKYHPELVALIPRGFSILVDHNDKEICRLGGLTKFDGISAIDDDSNIETHLIDYNIIKRWEEDKELEVSFQEKANGKMVIFKIFVHDDQTFILGGSKNVHHLWNLDNVYFDEDAQSKLSFDMIYLVCQNLPADVETIFNKTIIAEYVDGCHMVYAEAPHIVYFYPEEIATCREIISKQTTLPTSEQYTLIRDLKDIEGVVIIYRNTVTNEIYRQKHKTIWYVILRVIRESLCRRNKDAETADLHEKLITIIKKRSNDFLHLDEERLLTWCSVSERFIEFVKQSEYEFKDLGFNSDIGMARIWQKFLNTMIDI
jgi:hypothetical protein